MLSHVTLGVNDLEQSILFYDAILSTLSYQRGGRGDNWAGYGEIKGKGIDTLWILTPANGQPATAGNGTNVALLAPSRNAVDDFYRIALAQGGKDEGSPGVRAENHRNFYACYIRDPSGNKLLAVCHEEP